MVSWLSRDETHVFFIANPINSITAKMFIERFRISPQNVEIISLRASSTSLLSDRAYIVRENLLDRLKMKALALSGTGLKIREHLESAGKKFIIYASWIYPEVEEVSKSNFCSKIVYIEEGQLSYYMAKSYKNNRENNWKQRRKKISTGSIDHYFREGYAACIGISDDCFPLLDHNKKIILTNFDALAGSYIERLREVSCIGITPAPRRIPESAIASLAAAFCEAMPEGGVVKLHPGFKVHHKLRRSFIEKLKFISNGLISVVEDDVVVELEMLQRRKVLYGCRSSLSRYAKILGSEYIYIEFSGYIAPKN